MVLARATRSALAQPPRAKSAHEKSPAETKSYCIRYRERRRGTVKEANCGKSCRREKLFYCSAALAAAGETDGEEITGAGEPSSRSSNYRYFFLAAFFAFFFAFFFAASVNLLTSC